VFTLKKIWAKKICLDRQSPGSQFKPSTSRKRSTSHNPYKQRLIQYIFNSRNTITRNLSTGNVSRFSWFYGVSEKSLNNRNFIYYLHYMLYMFTPTLYPFSQLLYPVCADFLNILGSTVAQQSVILCLRWRRSRILTAYTTLTTTKKHYIHHFTQC
jgi:hypothetical protein